MDVAVLHLPAITVDEESEKAVVNGRLLALTQGTEVSEKICRAYARDGRFIAILRYEEERGCWKPEKVFRKRGRT
jgi:tRNA U55 pseudouridine synthase TruB